MTKHLESTAETRIGVRDRYCPKTWLSPWSGGAAQTTVSESSARRMAAERTGRSRHDQARRKPARISCRRGCGRCRGSRSGRHRRARFGVRGAHRAARRRRSARPRCATGRVPERGRCGNRGRLRRTADAGCSGQAGRDRCERAQLHRSRARRRVHRPAGVLSPRASRRSKRIAGRPTAKPSRSSRPRSRTKRSARSKRERRRASHGPRPRAFFDTLRTHTMEGMFADPVYGGNKDFAGWQLVGFPGVQLIYTHERAGEPSGVHHGACGRPPVQSPDGECVRWRQREPMSSSLA